VADEIRNGRRARARRIARQHGCAGKDYRPGGRRATGGNAISAAALTIVDLA
jgi:hypothetical protein